MNTQKAILIGITVVMLVLTIGVSPMIGATQDTIQKNRTCNESNLLFTSTQAKVILPNVTAADFFLEDAISGKTICLSNYSNKVVLLDFMTTWCSWCQKETDDILVPLHNQYYANGSKVVFLSIDIGDSTAQHLQAYAERHNINFSILMRDGTSGVADMVLRVFRQQ